MRLDHLLSKEEKIDRVKLAVLFCFESLNFYHYLEIEALSIFGGDALVGNTRSHFEHVG